jgi:hypothetical protein
MGQSGDDSKRCKRGPSVPLNLFRQPQILTRQTVNVSTDVRRSLLPEFQLWSRIQILYTDEDYFFTPKTAQMGPKDYGPCSSENRSRSVGQVLVGWGENHEV